MGKRRPPVRRKARARRLDVAAVAGHMIQATVPKRWVKFWIGLFLLPPALLLSQTFFTVFARTTLHDHFWMTEEFWFFSLGAVLWLVAFWLMTFFGLPRPVWLYVFGHELTHAIWVMLMGGKVHRFHVTRQGGHVLADRTNTLIALAPYFFPVYSVLAIGIYGLCALFFDVAPYHELLYAVIGATWAFHLSFTVWMIPKGQPDLHYGGSFFSLMVIYVLNLALLCVLLIIASPRLTWLGFGKELLQNTVDATAWATRIVSHLIHHFVR